jgi:hypothetical protein
MKNTEYYKSGRHKENALKAREKALIKSLINKQVRIEKYNLLPTICLNCNTPLSYRFRKNKFCNRSCAASYNNLRKPPRSLESKRKTSLSMVGKIRPNKIPPTHKMCKIAWYNCQSCNKLFYTKGWSNPRKSCGSRECRTHLSVGNRPYRNGRRKLFYYFNKNQNKEVLLESSWEYELAQWLDLKNVVWERPLYIKWYDEQSNKHRLYYPDFYLPKQNLYLDPKNPTSLKLEKNKMNAIEKLISIKYGNLEDIKKHLLSII